MFITTNTHAFTSERTALAITEKLWLMYFNDTLLSRGIITQTEHDKMRIKINNRHPLPS